ncbi:MAG: iron complex outermembrane receptor protein [Halioglobus sp.]|jgi:iron complex outermembrane receptor protein
MFRKTKLNTAVLSVIAAGMAVGHAGLAMAQLEEVIVTATKKSASMQDIAVSVQAMTGQDLEEQNIANFEDYVAHLPSVSMGGRGPGQNEIYIRGAAVDAINITVAESQGSAPNVALYLDELPVTAGGRNLDIYVSDLERIEVLPGPQGTLYGSSSQAGTVRLITNKPNTDQFEARFSAGYSMTEGGDDSNKVEAMINIPLIEDKLAVRAAFYNDNRGGYIDNVAGSFTADNAVNPTFPGDSVFYEAGTVFANGDVVGPGGRSVPVHKTSATNGTMVEDDFNDSSYQGMRLGIKYNINDDWAALLQFSQQTLRTDGVFDYDQSLGDLNVSRFTEDSLEDEFTQFAWTLEGRIGALDMIYTGGYLDREVSAKIDYTGYTNIGAFISGYQCEYLVGSFYHGLDNGYTTGYNFDPTIGGNPDVIECGTPANQASIENENTRQTHEFRISTDPDNRLRATGGIFYEDSEILHVGNFNYQAPIDAGFAPIDINTSSTFDTSDANARGLVTEATQFRNDNTRTEEQIAIFGEISFDLTDTLSVAVSGRYYDLEYGYTGYGAWRYGNRPLFVDDADPTNDIRPNVTGGREYEVNFAELQPISVDDTIVKFTMSWTPTDDLLFYGTYSEGYRPPGFNRAAAREGGQYNAGANNVNDAGLECGSDVAIDSNPDTGFPGYCLPYVFESDTLENYEFGWKATLMDGDMRLNGAIYRLDWEGIQVSQFDSQNISILTIVDNGGDAEILGMEVDFVWAATDNLTIFGAGSYNDTELTSVDPGFAIVVQDEGGPLPLTPEFQANLRARYSWDMANGMEAFWQVSGKYSDEALNSIVDTPAEPNTYQDDYTLFNAATGVRGEDGWAAELYIENLTDERAELHINRQDFIERTTTNRPRTVGLRVSYEFN